MPPLVVIVGETASGKSALAMELAQRFNGEIICADSWTVYKDFDIGTAKPSAADRALVPHHLIDVADPREGFSAAVFKQLAQQAIADITSRMRLPILVGGTGLYVDSILFDYGFLPAANPALRQELNLKKLDELLALAAQRGLDLRGIDARNKRRVIRLLENNGARPTRQTMRANTLVLGMAVPRGELEIRVAKRVDGMLAAGLEGEVRALAARYGWDVEPMKGIGYREWREYMMGDAAPGGHDGPYMASGGSGRRADSMARERSGESGFYRGGTRGDEIYTTVGLSRALTAGRAADGGGQSGAGARGGDAPAADITAGRSAAALQPAAGTGPAAVRTELLAAEPQITAIRTQIIRATMGLARRQRTWFKRNPGIQWVFDRCYTDEIVTTFLNKSD